MADPLNILSLFSGHGMLDEGIKLATPARCVGYVEREAYAASSLMARMEDKALEPAPVWVGDIQELDGRDLRGHVDLICGGFPCQDISAAGRGEGIQRGNRSGLWYEYARLIREVGPRLVFVENVRALLSRGLDIVLGDLAEMGFDAEWGVFSAAGVGAPHRRERVFILAHRRRPGAPFTGREPRPAKTINATSAGSEGLADAEHPERRREDEGRQAVGRVASGRSGPGHDEAVADTPDPDGRGRVGGTQEGTRARERGRGRPASGDTIMGDAESARREGRGDDGRLPDERLPFPPGPEDADAWGRILAQAPHLAPAVEPGVRVLADGVALVVDASRADQLRGCGNGVVALTAAVAFEVLSRRLMPPADTGG